MKKILTTLLFSLLATTGMAKETAQIAQDYNQAYAQAKSDEDSLVSAVYDFSIRSSGYEGVLNDFAVYDKADVLDKDRLELTWWRSKNPDVRKLCLLLYYTKYGTKTVSCTVDFAGNARVFEGKPCEDRLSEIHEVETFIRNNPARRPRPHKKGK